MFYYNGGFNIVDVKDVAKGHLLAAKKGKKGELYILGNDNVTVETFIRKVFKHAGFPETKMPRIPKTVIKAGTSMLTWWSDHVSNKPPLSTPKEIEYSSQYLFFDNSKAKEELGLELTPVDVSIQESINWFRKEGYAS